MYWHGRRMPFWNCVTKSILIFDWPFRLEPKVGYLPRPNGKSWDQNLKVQEKVLGVWIFWPNLAKVFPRVLPSNVYLGFNSGNYISLFVPSSGSVGKGETVLNFWPFGDGHFGTCLKSSAHFISVVRIRVECGIGGSMIGATFNE